MVASGAVTLLVGAFLNAPAASAAPAPPAAEPTIGAGVAALRAELSRFADQQRTGPAPIGEADLDALTSDLQKAADDKACPSAASLQRYADRIGRLADQVRRRVDAAAPAGAAELKKANAEYDRLLLDGARLRGQLLASVPPEEGCEGPIVVYVDAAKAKPGTPEPPAWDDRLTRPVAGMIDTEGQLNAFVANEVVVNTTDPAALKAFVDRWGGTVLRATEAKINDFVPQYLVRVDPTKAEPGNLSGLLAKLNGGATKADSLAVSSAAGLHLLTLAATEATDKIEVGVNWLAAPDTIPNGSTLEAPTGPAGFNNDGSTAYNRNAYNWSYLNSGSVQDIGATTAWTLLDSINRADNTVEIGVVDKGFRPAVNNDLPAGTTMTSVVPFVPADASGDSSSPWHGTDVAGAAAGVPDNGRGTAGSSGPVGRLNLVYSSYDYFTAINGLTAAAAAGSRIINMSFSARVHWSLSWTVLPFEAATKLVRSSGILLFASAGNDGRDVDAETCFITCWERHWHTPCENAGVRCVGGLGVNTLNRAGNSNYGHEDVDIFAPYTVLVGPNPAVPANAAHSVNGTSFSSPYTAGVAALIWAANPGLSAGSVETILFRNMRTSPDDKVKRRVINARTAVRDALPAVIAIKAPLHGATLGAGTATQFRANVFADGHGTPTVTWKRGTATALGTGNPITASLPPGVHDVTATATFPDGTVATDKIRVTAVNHAPTVRIVSPNDDGAVPVFNQSEPIAFVGTSHDPDTGALANAQVSWRLDGSATPFATGHSVTASTGAAPGPHTITFRGCDAFGACATDTVRILVRADTPNLPPTVAITNPLNGAQLGINGHDEQGAYHQITLGSSVSDPEGGPVSLVWTDSQDGGPAVQIGTGPSPTVKLRGRCGTSGHRLTLTATDNAGNVRQKTVEVRVDWIC